MRHMLSLPLGSNRFLSSPLWLLEEFDRNEPGREVAARVENANDEKVEKRGVARSRRTEV